MKLPVKCTKEGLHVLGLGTGAETTMLASSVPDEEVVPLVYNLPYRAWLPLYILILFRAPAHSHVVECNSGRSFAVPTAL